MYICIHDIVYLGQQTSQGSSPHTAPIPRGPGDGPSLSHARHQLGRRQTPTNLYSTSTATSSGVAGATYSSSVGGQSRGKGRMVGGYNEEGRPHSKRARMSTTVDEDGNDIDLEEGRGSNGRANPFITAKDQYVSSVALILRCTYMYIPTLATGPLRCDKPCLKKSVCTLAYDYGSYFILLFFVSFRQ